MTITLTDFDRAVANSRRNLEQLIAEQAAAEMAALQLLAEQIGQSEAERARVDAEQRRQAAQDAFEQGALADATATFASIRQRIGQLNAMIAQCEQMHETIVQGALAIQRETTATVNGLVAAMPEPSEEAATDALQRAGADAFAFSLPGWLKELNERRWMSAPSLHSWNLYQFARGLASERQRKR